MLSFDSPSIVLLIREGPSSITHRHGVQVISRNFFPEFSRIFPELQIFSGKYFKFPVYVYRKLKIDYFHHTLDWSSDDQK